MNRFFSGSLITFISAVLSAMHATDAARAGQITLADFSPAAVVENFEGLDAGAYLTTPVLIAGNTFQANNDLLDFSSKLGPEIGRSGVAIANRRATPPSQDGFIDITLGNPSLRAGLYVGSQNAWSLSVQFFGSNNSLLGTIGLSGVGKDSRFAAWQADIGAIGRIRAANMSNVEHGIIIDDLIREVPEPGSLLGFAMGALTVVGFWGIKGVRNLFI